MVLTPPVLLLLAAALLVVLGATAWFIVGRPGTVPYPAPVVRSLVDHCTRAGRDRATCSCVVEDVQQQFSLAQAIRLTREMRNSREIPPELAPSLAWCSG